MKTPHGDSTTPAADAEDVLIILPVRNMVLFPGVVAPLTVNRARTVAGLKEAVRTERKVGLLLQRAADLDDPAPEQLYHVGTVASVLRYVTTPGGAHQLVVQGERRFRVLDFQPGLPFYLARVEYLPLATASGTEVEARALNLKRLALEALELLPGAPAELGNALQTIESIEGLADLIASFLDVKPAEKQALLEITDLRARLEQVAALVSQRIEVLKLTRQIEERTREAIDGRQKEILLREQLKQIQRELGEGEDTAGEVSELREAIEKSGMAAETLEQVRKGVEAPRADARTGRRVFDAAHLPRSGRRAAVVEARRRAHRHRPGARSARERPLRPRQD